MKNLKIIIIISFISSVCLSQVHQEWVATYGIPQSNGESAYSITFDDSANVYITGGYEGIANSSCTTIKYNPSGIQQWVAKYHGNGSGYNNYGRKIKIDNNGNIFVTGAAYVNSSNYYDLILIKYNSSGVQQWVSSYRSAFSTDNCGRDLAIDGLGNIYVTGTRFDSTGNGEILTLKFNSSGNKIWETFYSGPTHNGDISKVICIDLLGNIYVSGLSWIINYQTQLFEYAIIKYNNNGVQQWVNRVFGSDNTSRHACGMTMDVSNNIYFSGSSGVAGIQNTLTMKINSSGGILWATTHTGIQACELSDIALDKRGNIYVTGYDNSPTGGFLTIKYNQTGAQQWLQIFPGAMHNAVGTKIATDSLNNVYVTGSGQNNQNGSDYITIKYDSSGVQKWLMLYNNTTRENFANDICVDKSKNVYITGESIGSAGSVAATIKYSQPIGINPISKDIPKSFSLSQNYPNPFNPSTKIKFSIPAFSPPFTKGGQGGLTTLVIYDILGREVATILNQSLQPGTYEVEFDGTIFSSGVYFYKLNISDPETSSGFIFTETKKLVLIK